MAFCENFPDKRYYLTFEAANQANSVISKDLANQGRLEGQPRPYRCVSYGVEHWHLGRGRRKVLR